MEVFTFDKSLQERLGEFSSILSRQELNVPASQIQSEWAYHVELVIEPVGWQGLWKIPRLTCQDFEIHYPTIVAVEVENVDFTELSALVKIIAVQDEIHLPEKYDVPLIELYPTQEQENSVLDMVATAECIDQLRFYYNYLWMPWDNDDDDDSDWVTLHLEPRLRLFYDMKRGAVCKKSCEIIRALMREGREIQIKISRLELDISDEEENRGRLLDDGKACQLMKLHFRLQQIKTEMEVLENPAMRDVLVRNQTSNTNEVKVKRRESRGRQKEVHFVWLGGTLEDTIDALKSTQEILPLNIFTKTCSSMQEALDISETGDVIVLGAGEHPVRSSGSLEEGGKIRGIKSVEDTIICPQENESGPTLLDFSDGEVTLENITIDLKELQAGVLVRKGTLFMNGCRILVSNQSVVKLGVVILSGAKLIAERTDFIGLGSAIVVHKGGDVVLRQCNFVDCVEGVLMYDNSRLWAENCSFTNLKEYGIRLETNKVDETSAKTGGLELVENIPGVSISSCKFENNAKDVVAIKPCSEVALSSKPKNSSPDFLTEGMEFSTSQ